MQNFCDVHSIMPKILWGVFQSSEKLQKIFWNFPCCLSRSFQFPKSVQNREFRSGRPLWFSLKFRQNHRKSRFRPEIDTKPHQKFFLGSRGWAQTMKIFLYFETHFLVVCGSFDFLVLVPTVEKGVLAPFLTEITQIAISRDSIPEIISNLKIRFFNSFLMWG